jgi:hypothetical protein
MKQTTELDIIMLYRRQPIPTATHKQLAIRPKIALIGKISNAVNATLIRRQAVADHSMIFANEILFCKRKDI